MSTRTLDVTSLKFQVDLESIDLTMRVLQAMGSDPEMFFEYEEIMKERFSALLVAEIGDYGSLNFELAVDSFEELPSADWLDAFMQDADAILMELLPKYEGKKTDG